MKDRQGREYAKIANVKVGDLIQVDGDFDCIKPWSIKRVADEGNGLYIPCTNGRHGLCGQIQDDFYIGLYPVELPK